MKIFPQHRELLPEFLSAAIAFDSILRCHARRPRCNDYILVFWLRRQLERHPPVGRPLGKEEDVAGEETPAGDFPKCRLRSSTATQRRARSLSV
jgi:hypothetical protein